MNKKYLALALVAFTPFAASAATASYQFVDLSYQVGGDIDVGIGSIDTDGYILKAAMPLGESLFLGLDYSRLNTDPSGVEFTDYVLALGLHGETFYAKFGYESAEFQACGAVLPPCVLEGNGYNLDLGMRSMMSERIEFNAHLGQSDLGDLGTMQVYGAGAVFLFTEHAGLSLNYDIRSNDNVDFVTYGLGFRMSFD